MTALNTFRHLERLDINCVKGQSSMKTALAMRRAPARMPGSAPCGAYRRQGMSLLSATIAAVMTGADISTPAQDLTDVSCIITA